MQVKVLAAELTGGAQVESKDVETITISNGKRLSFDVNLAELEEFISLHRAHIKGQCGAFGNCDEAVTRLPLDEAVTRLPLMVKGELAAEPVQKA